MRNPLHKRYLRELKNDFGKYTALFLFIVIMIGFCSGMQVADNSMMTASNASYDKYTLEDGHFVLRDPAQEDLIEALRKEQTTAYELFYKNKTSGQGHAVRVYRNREDVNLPCVMEGKLATQANEIAIDRLYAENNELSIGDAIVLDDISYRICGLVALPDYSCLFQNNTDMMFDASKFTFGLVTEEGFDALNDNGLNYCYAFVYDDRTLSDEEAKEKSDDILDVLIKEATEYTREELTEQSERAGSLLSMMLMFAGSDAATLEDQLTEALETLLGSGDAIRDFVSKQDNNAINFTADDISGDGIFMNVFLYIVICVLAFIFAVTTRSTIEEESTVIGTLRASGYTQSELLRHYLVLPTMITLLAALIGNILGYTVMKGIVVDMYYHSYSLPTYVTVWSPKAFVTTTLIPGLIVLTVNFFVIRRSLQMDILKFMRRDFSRGHKRRALLLPDRLSFLTRFRIRIIMQNKGAYLILFIGIFLSTLLMLFGLVMIPLLEHFRASVTDMQFASYQYVLKETLETKNEQAEKYAVCNLYNGREDISLYGITEDSAYLPELELTDSETQVYVSSAYADKYKVSVGDTFQMTEKYGSGVYYFSVKGIFDYDAALAMFMSLDGYRSLFDYSDSYYNGYFSEEELTDLKTSGIASIITLDDLTVMADQLEDSMGRIFGLFRIFAFFLYILIIYLLAKLIVDKNAQSISLMKILGYKDSEVSALYNTSTAIAFSVSLLVSLPLASIVLERIWERIMLDYTGWLGYYVEPWIWPAIVAIGGSCYLIVHLIQMRKISKISKVEILKNVL